MSTIDLSVGLQVQVQAGKGIVRWIGKDPEFAAGHWVGVELQVLKLYTLMVGSGLMD